MGQLEAYNINETILTGLMISTFTTNLSEALESITFESFKVYFYSANYASFKALKVNVTRLLAITPDNAVFNSWTYFDFTKRRILHITKLIDDIIIWQNLSMIDLKIDENVIKLQRKYNFG